MKKEKAIEIAKEIIEELDGWVSFDYLSGSSYHWGGTVYDHCVEMVADIILEWVNKHE